MNYETERNISKSSHSVNSVSVCCNVYNLNGNCMRDFRFRAWDKKYKQMASFENMMACRPMAISESLDSSQFIVLPSHENVILMQSTGHIDSRGVECYEGDIKREEIEMDDGDLVYYYVCVWVKEWAMFCWLSYNDGEYDSYLREGASVLDETMFWTYAFDADDISRSTVCGNIYQHPNLLK